MTDDFASAAMMRLVAEGLARQGLTTALRPQPGAHVERREKRAVLETVFVQHGPRAILAIADSAPDMSPEPVVQALMRARGMADLIDRWQRLERFSHARHRVNAEPVGDDALRLTHRALDRGPSPSRAESLLVYGVLTVLAEMTIPATVTLAADTGEVWRNRGTWTVKAGRGGTGPVHLSMSAEERTDAASLPRTLADLPRRMRDLLAGDPLRRWYLRALASEMRMSPRTLQRRLTEHGLSFSSLVADMRLQAAAAHLCDPLGPGLAEIGFLAGYADQAHFARAFRRAVGTTPQAFRSDFQSRPS
jgi:AraC-like DNA-binding protein